MQTNKPNNSIRKINSSVAAVLFLIFVISCIYEPVIASQNIFYNIKDFGAIGDGKIKDTEAIQSAIDSAHDSGGGTVYFPAGIYLSGTLMLRDNITLHFEAGCILLGIAPCTAMVLVWGYLARGNDGHTLVTFSTAGLVHEVTPDGEVVWELAMGLGGALGYMTWVESL